MRFEFRRDRESLRRRHGVDRDAGRRRRAGARRPRTGQRPPPRPVDGRGGRARARDPHASPRQEPDPRRRRRRPTTVRPPLREAAGAVGGVLSDTVQHRRAWPAAVLFSMAPVANARMLAEGIPDAELPVVPTPVMPFRSSIPRLRHGFSSSGAAAMRRCGRRRPGAGPPSASASRAASRCPPGRARLPRRRRARLGEGGHTVSIARGVASSPRLRVMRPACRPGGPGSG